MPRIFSDGLSKAEAQTESKESQREKLIVYLGMADS